MGEFLAKAVVIALLVAAMVVVWPIALVWVMVMWALRTTGVLLVAPVLVAAGFVLESALKIYEEHELKDLRMQVATHKRDVNRILAPGWLRRRMGWED